MDTSTKIHSERESLLTFVEAARSEGKSIAFTNGCYDLVHSGHVRTLEFAASQADLLVVALNSDASVRRLKGEARPILPYAERARLLAAFACVAAVTCFEEDTPAQIIQALQPDVLVKGGDWAQDAIVGRDTVEARGGRVERVPLVEGASTTNIIDIILSRLGKS